MNSKHWRLKTDEEVATACSSNPEAAAELFRRFNTPISKFILKRIKNPADAEDLTQSIFIDVARGKAQYSSKSKVNTWLCGIAVNKARMFWKKSKRIKKLSDDFGDTCITVVKDPHGMLMIGRAIVKLPKGLRDAFLLCDVKGLTAREASVILSTTEEAVWKRVSYARAALSKRIGG